MRQEECRRRLPLYAFLLSLRQPTATRTAPTCYLSTGCLRLLTATFVLGWGKLEEWLAGLLHKMPSFPRGPWEIVCVRGPNSGQQVW